MIIQMAKFTNPEHVFYIPYLQPVKAKCEEEKQFPELVDFVLPKEALVMIADDGVERIFVGSKPVQVLTDAFSGLVYLVNDETYLRMDIHRVGEAARVIAFPLNRVAQAG